MAKLVGITLVSIFLESFIYAERPGEYQVSIDISSRPVIIKSVNSPKIVDKKFVRNDPLKSYLIFELSRDFERGACGRNDLGFELEYSPESKYPQVVLNVYLKLPKTNSQIISLTEPEYPAIAIGGKFKSMMKLGVYGWGPSLKELTWRYNFVNRDLYNRLNTVKVLTIKYNASSGWVIN